MTLHMGETGDTGHVKALLCPLHCSFYLIFKSVAVTVLTLAPSRTSALSEEHTLDFPILQCNLACKKADLARSVLYAVMLSK